MGKPLVATRSKLVGGILQFVCFKEANRHSLSDVKHERKPPYRSGAGEAREAHNLEDVGSNPTSGIITLRSF